MIKKNSKQKGYTLLELLIVTGLVSLAAASVYGMAKVASDWSKSSRETEKLQALFRQIDDSTSMVGAYTGIEQDNLTNISSGIVSSLGLNKVVSPSPKKLNFEYKNVSARICRDLTGKMLSSSSAVNVVVNDSVFSKTSQLGNLVAACDNSDNDVTIVLNKYQDDFTTASITASVNTPVPPTAFPNEGNYIPPAVMGNPYVTSTVNPVRYNLTDFPPNSIPTAPSTPPGIYQPPVIPPGGVTTPPFVPPPVTSNPPPGGVGGGGGSGTNDSWVCTIGTCSVAFYVENDGSSNYIGLTMFPSTPSIAAKAWKNGDLANGVEDKEVIVSPTVINSGTQVPIAGGWSHDFNYTALRNAIVQYGVGDANIDKLDLDDLMGSVVLASNGARFQIGSLERTVPSVEIYGWPYTGRVNFYFMKRL